MRSGRRIRLAALLCAALFLAGCQANIREDAVREDLPALDPQAGVARDITVTRYYRLTGEPYLVGVTRSVAVRANERTEYAIIRSLLEGVPALANDVSAVFPAGTSIVDVTLDGGILYVTLSREFMDETAFNRERAALQNFLSKGSYTQAEYDARIAALTAELYQDRSLGVYALVNTLTGYSDGIRVLVLVDTGGAGGVRLPRAELGIADAADADSDLIEPMGFTAAAVATPQSIAERILTHLCAGEYASAYALFADDENSEQQKPTYANFETEMLSLGSLRSFTIHAVRDGDGTAYADADLVFEYADGTQTSIVGAELPLRREGDVYKMGYASYKHVLEGR